MPRHETASGGSLYYEIHGVSGPLMLMLHGLTQSGQTFRGMAAALATDRHLLVCDLPGHGESYRPQRYEADAMIADVAGLLAAHSDEPAIIYGHSLGSLVATGIAAEQPELVSRLILSDPPLIVWDAERWKGSIISSYFGWARKTLRAELPVEQIIPMLQVAFPHRGEDVLSDQAQALTRLDVAIIDALFDDEITSLEEVLAGFEKLQCETLLMQADPAILAAASDADIAAIQARAPHSRHVKFKGADHDLHLWKPGRVLDAVRQFLG